MIYTRLIFFFCLKGQDSLISYSLLVEYSVFGFYILMYFCSFIIDELCSFRKLFAWEKRGSSDTKVLLTRRSWSNIYYVHLLLKCATFLKDSWPLFILLVVWLVLHIPRVIWHNLWPSNLLTLITYTMRCKSHLYAS